MYQIVKASESMILTIVALNWIILDSSNHNCYGMVCRVAQPKGKGSPATARLRTANCWVVR